MTHSDDAPIDTNPIDRDGREARSDVPGAAGDLAESGQWPPNMKLDTLMPPKKLSS